MELQQLQTTIQQLIQLVVQVQVYLKLRKS
jgi:hypothetical protein